MTFSPYPKTKQLAYFYKKKETKKQALKGKKTMAWEKARANLKQQFKKMNITSCELAFNGCLGDNYLGFAHKDKRRYLQPEELYEVCLACQKCHYYIERLPRPEMRAIIEAVINNRDY